MAKKKCAYVSYAVFNRKRYEKISGKKLSVGELINHAKEDWENEGVEVKDFFKSYAKGLKTDQDYPKMETSSQRMDTEAPIISTVTTGDTINNKKKTESYKESTIYELTIRSVEDIVDRAIGVIDFNIHVDNGDGLCVPAEYSVTKGTIRGGLTEEVGDLVKIDPAKQQNIIPGKAFEVRTNCEKVHGIDIYNNKILNEMVSMKSMCVDILDITDNGNLLLLCRKEDLINVLGSWYWLQSKKQDLPDLKVMTIENYMSISTERLNLLTDEYNTNGCGHNKKGNFPAFIDLGEAPKELLAFYYEIQEGKIATANQFTELMSKPTYDYEKSFRCDYHNRNAIACDKISCAKKNTKKYFFLMLKYILDFLPEIEPVHSLHCFKTEHVASGKNKARVPANTPAALDAVKEWDYTEIPLPIPSAETAYHQSGDSSAVAVMRETDTEIHVPRRPEKSFSSREKCCKMSPRRSPEPSSHHSEESSGRGDHTTEQLQLPPRRPGQNATKSKCRSDSSSYNKKTFTYDAAVGKCVTDDKPVIGESSEPTRGYGRGRRGASRANASEVGQLFNNAVQSCPSSGVVRAQDSPAAKTTSAQLNGSPPSLTNAPPTGTTNSPPPGFALIERLGVPSPPGVPSLPGVANTAKLASFGRGQMFRAAQVADTGSIGRNI